MRGAEMTRIEVFVDAAFAFAVTMLVISFDAIPRTYDEMVLAFKTIPAFITAVAQLVWIWQTHSVWSERYGLSDGATVWLSTFLLMVVLIYIYPMRVMLEGMFAFFSDGYFPSSFDFDGYGQLRFMFVFLGAAFLALSLSFVMLYGYALKRAEELVLNQHEKMVTSNTVLTWSGCMVIAAILIVVAIVIPEQWIPYTGFVMALLGVWMPYAESRKEKSDKNKD